MKNVGGLIFAHNSEQIDYALLAVIAAGLAKSHLAIPFTLITDSSTLEWMKKSDLYNKALSIFEHIKIFEVANDNNKRRLMDGKDSQIIPFKNSSRSQAYFLTPYERTLLIDSDFLINSQNLLPYLNSDYPMMISRSMNPINGADIGIHDRYVSDVGIRLFWATCMIFNKNKENELLFSLVDHIKNNYHLYSDLYGYQNTIQFRNDIAFSIAIHIISGFIDNRLEFLPSLLTAFDNEVLLDVDDNRYKFLVENGLGSDSYILCSTKKLDIHVMNKQSIVRNKDKLLALI